METVCPVTLKEPRLKVLEAVISNPKFLTAGLVSCSIISTLNWPIDKVIIAVMIKVEANIGIKYSLMKKKYYKILLYLIFL